MVLLYLPVLEHGQAPQAVPGEIRFWLVALEIASVPSHITIDNMG